MSMLTRLDCLKWILGNVRFVLPSNQYDALDVYPFRRHEDAAAPLLYTKNPVFFLQGPTITIDIFLWNIVRMDLFDGISRALRDGTSSGIPIIPLPSESTSP